MSAPSLTKRVERALEASNLHVVVEEAGDRLILSGHVGSAGDRQAAEDVARQIAPDRRVDNNLEVDEVLPQEVGDLYSDNPSPSDLPESRAELASGDSELEPDFTDQQVMTNPLAAGGPSSSVDDPAQEGDEVYVPPTDPVVTTDAHGQAEVLGGFETTSDEDIPVARSASDGQPGDEAIADAIRRELREDAATTDLQIRVVVRQGVAHLIGKVPSLDDAEQAEAVAARVPGLVEVREELDVETL